MWELKPCFLYNTIASSNVITTAVNWLNPEKSLREQGIEESSTLTLRRKYFFSDQNIDCNDPIQLNLLYVQVKQNDLYLS